MEVVDLQEAPQYSWYNKNKCRNDFWTSTAWRIHYYQHSFFQAGGHPKIQHHTDILVSRSTYLFVTMLWNTHCAGKTVRALWCGQPVNWMKASFVSLILFNFKKWNWVFQCHPLCFLKTLAHLNLVKKQEQDCRVATLRYERHLW